MKELTQSEVEILMKAEDVLFSHTDDELEPIFSNSAIELFKAIRKYANIVTGETEYNIINRYVNADIMSLNEFYNKKVGE